MLPQIFISFENYYFQIDLYKILLPLLVLLLLWNTFNYNKKIISLYLIFILYSSSVTVYTSIQVIQYNLLLDSEINRILYHKVTQFLVYSLFITVIASIAFTNIKSKFLFFIVKGYILSLFIHLIIAWLVFFNNYIGLIPLDLGNSIGIHKLQGLLGEPKQLSAAFFSGFLLLRFSLRNSPFYIINKNFSRVFQFLFLISAIASFSTSFYINLLLMLLIMPFIGYPIAFRLLIGIIIFSSFLILYTNKPCELQFDSSVIEYGLNSIYHKVYGINRILSYLPKDGIIIVDIFCNPSQYIFGGGGGSLFERLITGQLGNANWYENIQIFREIINRESFITQGPSTLQVQLFSDYGIIGILLFSLFILSAESKLSNKNMNFSLIIFYLFIFINSQTYLWFLLIMHFIILKLQFNHFNFDYS